MIWKCKGNIKEEEKCILTNLRSMGKQQVVQRQGNEKDLAELDELLNERAAEGWELVTYDYMATSLQARGAFVITFRKAK